MTGRGGDRTAEAIHRAAIRLFYKHGYEATTLRDLAREVDLQVGSLYNHIRSKEELLYDIMSGIMRELLDAIDRALAGRTDPLERMRAALECHIAFHAGRAEEVFIGNSELRSLPSVRRAAVVELRDHFEAVFRDLIESGVRAGVFHVADARLTAYVLMSMGHNVSQWYRPGGRMTLEEVASVYTDFALRGLTNPERQVALGDVLASPVAPADSSPVHA